jgi:putative membrane protein
MVQLQKKSWIKKYLNEQQIQAIEKAVFEVEQSTSGEIVPMIVKSSSRWGHVPITLFCLFMILFSFLSHTTIFEFWSLPYYLLWIIGFFLSSLGTVILFRIDTVKRFLSLESDLDFQVHQQAELAFYRAKLNQTQNSTGILIFLSMMEHEVVVLADESIAAKLPASTWSEVVQLIIDGIKQNDLENGFIKAIHLCGEIIKPHFPAHGHNPNELKNHLVIED